MPYKSIEKKKESNRKRKAERVEKSRSVVWAILEASACVDCGAADPLVLQFDHVEGEKVANVIDMVCGGYQLKRILAEIIKCETRCANCHQVKTQKQFKTWRTKQ